MILYESSLFILYSILPCVINAYLWNTELLSDLVHDSWSTWHFLDLIQLLLKLELEVFVFIAVINWYHAHVWNILVNNEDILEGFFYITNLCIFQHFCKYNWSQWILFNILTNKNILIRQRIFVYVPQWYIYFSTLSNNFRILIQLI